MSLLDFWLGWFPLFQGARRLEPLVVPLRVQKVKITDIFARVSIPRLYVSNDTFMCLMITCNTYIRNICRTTTQVLVEIFLFHRRVILIIITPFHGHLKWIRCWWESVEFNSLDGQRHQLWTPIGCWETFAEQNQRVCFIVSGFVLWEKYLVTAPVMSLLDFWPGWFPLFLGARRLKLLMVPLRQWPWLWENRCLGRARCSTALDFSRSLVVSESSSLWSCSHSPSSCWNRDWVVSGRGSETVVLSSSCEVLRINGLNCSVDQLWPPWWSPLDDFDPALVLFRFVFFFQCAHVEAQWPRTYRV